MHDDWFRYFKNLFRVLRFRPQAFSFRVSGGSLVCVTTFDYFGLLTSLFVQ